MHRVADCQSILVKLSTKISLRCIAGLLSAVSVKKALIWTHCEYLEIQTKIEFKNFQKKPTAKSITSYSDFRQTT